MARREQTIDLTNLGELSQAGGWWGLAQQSSGEAKKSLLAMALKHYWEAASADSDEEVQLLAEGRLRQALAVLPQRDYLFFKEELSVEGVKDSADLRGYQVSVRGVISPFGLSVEPPANGSSRVVYRLDGPYKKFQGS